MARGGRRAVTQAILARHPRSGGRAGVSPRQSTRPRIGVGPARVAPAPGRVRGARPAPVGKGGVGGGKGPGGAPGGPGGAPGPAPIQNPTPWSSRYEQSVGASRKRYLDSSSNFDLAEQQAKQDYGVESGFNDYKANPYSRAALLEQSYQRANKGTINAAGLQLYSGSTSNRLSANRAANSEDRNRLMRDYQESLGEISTGRAEAAARKGEEEQEAYWDRIAEAEKSEPEAQAAPAGGKGKGKGRKPHRPAPARRPVARGRRAR